MTIAVLGEALIDFIKSDDGAYLPHLGGSPYNVAIGLARHDVDVSYISPLSDDSFGDDLRNSLRSEGVVVPIARRSAWPTSLSLVTTDKSGLPTYRLYRQGVADKDTSFEEICANLPTSLRVFHTGSLAITPSQLPTVRKLFKNLRDREVIISIDLNIRLGACHDTRAYLDGVWSLLPEVDIVKASDEDLAAFNIDADPMKGAAVAFSEMGSGMLLLTEGRGGAVLHTPRGTIARSAYPVAHVRDSVGAGDSFHAAFLASLCASGAIDEPFGEEGFETLSDALDFSCAAAAINVGRVGCNPPTWIEVEAFLQAAKE